jgi:hypothetical protein
MTGADRHSSSDLQVAASAPKVLIGSEAGIRKCPTNFRVGAEDRKVSFCSGQDHATLVR